MIPATGGSVFLSRHQPATVLLVLECGGAGHSIYIYNECLMNLRLGLILSIWRYILGLGSGGLVRPLGLLSCV